MTLPTDFPFTSGQEGVNTSELRNAYRQIARAHNGFQGKFSPFVLGTQQEGDNARLSSTYDFRVGYLQLKNQIALFWFDIQWKEHNGSGNAALYLPCSTMGIAGSPWVNPVISSGAIASSNSYLEIVPGTSIGNLMSQGQPVPLTSSGRLQGTVCYMAKTPQALG